MRCSFTSFHCNIRIQLTEFVCLALFFCFRSFRLHCSLRLLCCLPHQQHFDWSQFQIYFTFSDDSYIKCQIISSFLERRSKKNAHHWRIHEKSAFKNNSTTVYDLLLHKSGLVWAFRSVFLLDLCYSFLWREFLSFSCSSLCAFFVFVVAICDVPKFILFNKCYACMNTPG